MQAMMGQGVDRHLLGLKMTAAENGMETSGLFTDVAYSRSQYFRISSAGVYNIVNPCHKLQGYFFTPGSLIIMHPTRLVMHFVILC